jgi:hypothetical protein
VALKTRLAPGLSLTGLSLMLVGCLALTACGSMRAPTLSNPWPFQKKAKPVPEAVNELNLVNADGTPASFPQYWKRNTLVIDLSGIGGAGNIAARLPEETTWPVRVAVRVRPGSVGQLEILGEERNVLPVATEGVAPIDLELAPSVYTPRTAAIYISWGPMPAFVDTAPVDTAPAFVSPTEVPRSAAEASSDEATPSASDIVSPAEAQPAQPPGPGS